MSNGEVYYLGMKIRPQLSYIRASIDNSKNNWYYM